MKLDWSEQAPHIRSLFREWQPGDGYEEAEIAAAEARLGVRLPDTLRSFYAAWGRRGDLTGLCHHLLEPTKLVVHSGALIFCVENQGVLYWAIPLQRVGEPDPPVIIAVAGQEMSVREAKDELTWRPSHPHVSAFLDDLAYLHAFCYGALHTAESPEGRASPEQIEWLEQNWGKAKLTAVYGQMHPEATSWFMYPIYVRDGQALTWYQSWWAVTSAEEAPDEIARELGIMWQTRR